MIDSKSKIILFNDKAISNEIYRLPIIELLREHNLEILSAGLSNFYYLIFYRKNNLISSNIKANILTLIINSKNHIVILNGFGRYKKNRFFRFLLIFLIKKFTGTIYVQNYHDYRYLRKFHHSITWVLGSGAKQKNVGKSGSILVSRNNKILLQKAEYEHFIKSFPYKKLKIVGVTDSNLIRNQEIIGRVPQNDILSFGCEFVWFGGYGDGFPHALADALYNDMPVILSRRELIRLGLYKLESRTHDYHNGWVKITQIENNEVFSSSWTSRIYTENFLNNNVDGEK